jgi:hypothetical protein
MGSGSACTELTVTSRSCASRASPTGRRAARGRSARRRWRLGRKRGRVYGRSVHRHVCVAENQPAWAINFVRSTCPLSDGRYAVRTPAGELIYRIEEDSGCRTVDFVYETPEGETTMILPTRVVPHGRGSVFTFTIHRQHGMSDLEWEEGQRGSTRSLWSSRSCLRCDASVENQPCEVK